MTRADARRSADDAACRYCERRFPDEAARDAHLAELDRAGMLQDHMEIHGKGPDPFRDVALELGRGSADRARAEAGGDATAGLAWWVDALTRRRRE